MRRSDFCIIGLGRFGNEVAFQLHKMGKNIMVIDQNKDLIQKASKIYDLAIICDASDINSLSETGIINVNSIIVAVDDIEASIMICANLRELGHKDIIAKANNSIHKRVLKTMGVGRVVIPEIEIADRIAFQSLFNVGVDITSIGSGFSWVKTSVSNSTIFGKTIAEINIRGKYDATIMMIQRKGEVIFPPLPNTKIEVGDVLTLMCRDTKISQILRFFVKSMSTN